MVPSIPVPHGLSTIILIWNKVSQSLRMRDRSVKVIQYGCQMILGYYGTILSNELKTGLASSRRTASNSRKVFWILKFVNHLIEVRRLIVTDSLSSTHSIANKYDFLQQISWVLYFFCENQVLLARLKLFGFDESKIDPWCNLTWVCGDIACFLADLTKYANNYWRRQEILNQLNDMQSRHRRLVNDRQIGKLGGGRRRSTERADRAQLLDEYETLEASKFNLQLSLAIVRPQIEFITTFSNIIDVCRLSLSWEFPYITSEHIEHCWVKISTMDTSDSWAWFPRVSSSTTATCSQPRKSLAWLDPRDEPVSSTAEGVNMYHDNQCLRLS